jgi:hypothetical protein
MSQTLIHSNSKQLENESDSDSLKLKTARE